MIFFIVVNSKLLVDISLPEAMSKWDVAMDSMDSVYSNKNVPIPHHPIQKSFLRNSWRSWLTPRAPPWAHHLPSIRQSSRRCRGRSRWSTFGALGPARGEAPSRRARSRSGGRWNIPRYGPWDRRVNRPGRCSSGSRKSNLATLVIWQLKSFCCWGSSQMVGWK